MKPYYEHRGITLYHGDCRQVLPLMADAHFGLVLTDAPYSAQAVEGARTNRIPGGMPLIEHFSSMTDSEIADVFALCADLLDGWLVSFIDWQHAAALAGRLSPKLRFVRLGVWDKPNAAPQLSSDRPAMGWEAIAIFHTPGRMRWNGGGQRAVWTCVRADATHHPTQKPLALVKRLLALFARDGDVVLDPFMGSGTTLRAAKDLGFRAVGIEVNERFCELAVQQLRQEVLFGHDVEGLH